MTHQRSPNFSLPFVSRWLFVSRLEEVFVGCQNSTKTLRSKTSEVTKWQPLWHHSNDWLTLTIWGHCVWASESSSAFGQFLDRRDQLMKQINVSGCMWRQVQIFSWSDIFSHPIFAKEILPLWLLKSWNRWGRCVGSAGEKNDSMKQISTALSQVSILKLIRWL